MTEETPLEEQCRELVEEWRDDAEEISELDGAHDIQKCADELEAILDE